MTMFGAVISLTSEAPGSSFFFAGSNDVRQLIENPENNIDLKRSLDHISVLLQSVHIFLFAFHFLDYFIRGIHIGAVDPATCRVQGLTIGASLRNTDETDSDSDDDDPLKEPHPSRWIYKPVAGKTRRDWERVTASQWLLLRFGNTPHCINDHTTSLTFNLGQSIGMKGHLTNFLNEALRHRVKCIDWPPSITPIGIRGDSKGSWKVQDIPAGRLTHFLDLILNVDEDMRVKFVKWDEGAAPKRYCLFQCSPILQMP